MQGLAAALVAVLVVLWAAPRPAAPTHACRYRLRDDQVTNNSTWQRCQHFHFSDYCCSGAVDFEEAVIDVIAALDRRGPTPTVNISFSAATDLSSSFLVRRALGCSAPSECFDLAVAAAAVGVVDVELTAVPALPGDGAYLVARLDYAGFNHWLSQTTNNNSSTETTFLHDSKMLLDIKGSDAELRVSAPTGWTDAVPGRFAAACLTLTSGAGAPSCSGCHCSHAPGPTGGPAAAGSTRALCVSNPYDGRVIRVENATGFYNGSHSFPHASAVVGNACLRAQQGMPLQDTGAEPDSLAPVGAANLTAVWASLAALALVAVLAVFLLLHFRRRGLGRAALRDDVAEDKVPMARGPYRALLLYRRQPQQPLFQQAVDLLRAALAYTEDVEVLDPYVGAAVLERSVVDLAYDLVARRDMHVVFVATEDAFASEPAERLMAVHDRFFHAAKRQVESRAGQFGGGRILTLTMSPDLKDSMPAFWAQRVYFLPPMIRSLLSDIPGALTTDTQQISDLNLLRRTIERYSKQIKANQQDLENNVV